MPVRSRPNTNHVDLMVCDAKVSIHSLLLRLGQGGSRLADFDPKVGQTGPNTELFQLRFQYISTMCTEI